MAISYNAKPQKAIAEKDINKALGIVAKHKPKMLVAQTEGEMLADELIQITNKLRELDVAEMTKRQTEIKTYLQSIAKNSPPAEQVIFEGQLGSVLLTACATNTVIEDMDGLISFAEQKVGKEAIMATVKVTLGDLSKILSENEIAKFSTTKPGSRQCKVVPKKPA